MLTSCLRPPFLWNLCETSSWSQSVENCSHICSVQLHPPSSTASDWRSAYYCLHLSQNFRLLAQDQETLSRLDSQSKAFWSVYFGWLSYLNRFGFAWISGKIRVPFHSAPSFGCQRWNSDLLSFLFLANLLQPSYSKCVSKGQKCLLLARLASVLPHCLLFWGLFDYSQRRCCWIRAGYDLVSRRRAQIPQLSLRFATKSW